MTVNIGDKIRMSHTHSDSSVVRYSGVVRKIDGDTVWVEFPKRVLSMPFPPNNGKRFAQYKTEDIEQCVVRR